MVDLFKIIDDFENSAKKFCEERKLMTEKLSNIEASRERLNMELRNAEYQIAELKKELIIAAGEGLMRRDNEKAAIKSQIQDLVRDIENTIEQLNI